MILKLLVLVLLAVILYCLASAAFFLIRAGRDDKRATQKRRLAKALTWRIGLSVAVFLLLLLAFQQGWIVPHGIVPPH